MITDVLFAIIIVGSFLAIITALLIVMIKRINALSRKNFNDKLQEYDSLIDEREKRVSDLDGNILTKQAKIDELDDKVKDLNGVLNERESASLNSNSTLMSGGAVMEKEDVMREQYHKIRNEFNFNQRDVVLNFIKEHPILENERKKYDWYKKIDAELSRGNIFKIMSLPKKQQAEEFSKLFSDEDMKLLDELPGGRNADGGFNLQKNLRSFKSLYNKSDPVYYVYTPYPDTNSIGELNNVQVIKDDHITEGFRIMHHGKVYDYSI